MSEQLTLKERVRAIQPGTRIFDKIWTRCSPDNPNYASHMEQLFEAEVINAALVAALKAVLAYPCACYSVMDPNWHSDTCIKTTVRAALRDAGEPL
jgi:hypothetical protein